MIFQFLANGLIIGSIYSLVGLGFALVYNTTKIFHIAYAAVYTTSAYIFYFFYRIINFPLSFSLLIGILSGAILNILIEVLIYKPAYLRKSSPAISLISSIGCYIVIVNLLALSFGNETKILSPGIEKSFQFGNVILTRIQIVQFFAFILLFLLYLLSLRKIKFGKLIRAFANNPDLLSSCGIEILNLRILIFALSGVFAGVASCLVALDTGMDPNVGMPILLVGMVSLIIGGVGIFESAVIGGFLIGIIQNLVVWKISARWQDCITFLLLIIFLLFRPQGILGIRKRTEEI